ncbi:MAG: transglutaminase domain-containing protein, partial [Spirochaetaceae bacterium]|nr:transglutaminase domain-containing protein [Spirochaetaceae bacterium]
MGRWLKILLLFLPVILWIVLDHLLTGSGNFLMLFAYTVLPALGIWELFFPSKHQWQYRTALILLTTLGILLVLEIMMMPFQAYQLWFEFLARESSRGRVSQLFIKLGAILAGTLSWYIIRKKGFILDLLYLPFFFFFLLYPSIYTAMGCVTALLLPMMIGRFSPYMIAVLFISLLIGISGINTEPQGLKWVDQGTGVLYNTLIDRFPQLPLYYQMPLYGQDLKGSMKDGRRPTLTHQSLLQLEGPPGTWVYLRARNYRDFNSYGQMIFQREPLEREDLEPSDLTPDKQGIKVTLLTDFMNILPLTMDTHILETSQGRYLWDRPKQSLLWTEPPLLYEDSYTIYEEHFIEIEDSESLEPYRKPPPNMSDRMMNLARELYDDDPEICANNIRRYLAVGYQYTLKTEPHENYTEHFLFENPQGYCLHFATAFMYLARLNNIPTRMVEGYVSYLPSGMDTQGTSRPGITWVTGYSSHTWPEIYIEGKGWRIIEATPPFYHPPGEPPADMSYLSQASQMEEANNTFVGFIV